MNFFALFNDYLKYDYAAAAAAAGKYLESGGQNKAGAYFVLAKSKVMTGGQAGGGFECAASIDAVSAFDWYFKGRAAAEIAERETGRRESGKVREFFDKSLSMCNDSDEYYCYIKAWMLLYQKRYAEAYEGFKNAIGMNDGLTAAYYHRGFASAALKQYGRAAEDFEVCVSKGIPWKTVYKLLGHAYFKQENYKEAVRNYDVFLRTHPDDIPVSSECGKAFFALGNYLSAETYLTRALKHNPDDADLRFCRAAAHKKQGNYAKAISDYTKIILEYPEEIAARIERGNCYLAQNLVSEALDDFNVVLKQNPQETAVYYNLAQVKMGMGRFSEAAEDLSKVVSADPDDWQSLFLRAKCYVAADRLSDAIKDLESCVRSFPERFEPALMLARLYLDSSRKSLAQSTYEALINRGCDDIAAFSYLIKVYYENGEHVRCCKLCSFALEIHKDNTEILRFMSKASLAAGDRKAAVDCLQEILRINPKDVTVKVEIAYLLRKEGKSREIAESLRGEIDGSQEVRTLMVYAEACYNNGDRKEAESAYKKAAALDPSNAVARNNLGKLYEMSGKKTEAIKEYSAAIEASGNYAAAYNNRGVLYFERADYDQAVSDYDQAIRIESGNPLFYYNRALAYEFSEVKKNIPLAIADYRRVIELDPSNSEALQALSKLGG